MTDRVELEMKHLATFLPEVNNVLIGGFVIATLSGLWKSAGQTTLCFFKSGGGRHNSRPIEQFVISVHPHFGNAAVKNKRQGGHVATVETRWSASQSRRQTMRVCNEQHGLSARRLVT